MRFCFLLSIITWLLPCGDCRVLTEMYGRISSPGYPKPYLNDQTLTWKIQVPEGYRIKIYFTHFHLELSYLCDYDYVKLTSREKEVASLCGRKSITPGDTSFYSLDNKMSVTFHSDYLNKRRYGGFEAFYVAEDINECERQNTEEEEEACDHYCHNHIGRYSCSCRPGYTLHTDKRTCLVKCNDGTFTASSGEITSPHFSGYHPKLIHCKYQIQAEEGFSIRLRFLHIDVHPCDRLQITAEGRSLNPPCGETLPAEIDTHSNHVIIVFTTHGSENHTEWSLHYSTGALPCADPVPPLRGRLTPENKTYVVNDSLSLTCEDGYELVEDGRTVRSFSAVCRPDRRWDKPMPTCVIVDCGSPSDIDNGNFIYVTTSDVTTYRAVILYKCISRFYVIKDGAGQYQCGAGGEWEETHSKKTTPPRCVPDCGRRVSQLSRIFGGHEATLGQFPWQVYILVNGYQGGGALLNDYWIITAAHNVHKVKTKDLQIKMGIVNVSESDTNAYEPVPKSIYTHPSYNATTFDNDIALIKLKHKVPINANMLGICLPTKDERFQISHNADRHNTGQVSGWGLTEKQTLVRQLRFVSVSVVSHDQCVTLYKEKQRLVTENMICAGHPEGKNDSCTGDSGGALAFYDWPSNNWFIGGIVSWGLDCGIKGQYGVYTKVSNYLDWIQSIFRKK
ncbi:mannan-binding lectin serine protease 2-like isoform X2 [Hyperolius riggenbachi]|uniref:mannan-binding lectin serine protease 2-like isoform X2 n=1 Tax=Hyperolius riggenbachi TaxID=752182 RepID=UPI0035A2FF9F